MSRSRLLAVLGPVMLLAAACGASEAAGDSDTTVAATSTIEELSTSTSTVVTDTEATSTDSTADETTTSQEVSTTIEAPPEDVCSSPDLPSGNSTAPAVVDVDADGVADTAYMIQTSTGWQAVIEFGGGGSTVSPIAGTNDFDQPFVMGAADLDGDGVDEMAISLGTGAYVGLIGFVRVRDCEIVQLAFEDSSPAVFATGASVGGGEALVCNGDGSLEVFFFSLVPGSDAGAADAEYEAGFEPFKIEGDVIVAYPGDGASLTGAELESIELLDCLGLELLL